MASRSASAKKTAAPKRQAGDPRVQTPPESRRRAPAQPANDTAQPAASGVIAAAPAFIPDLPRQAVIGDPAPSPMPAAPVGRGMPPPRAVAKAEQFAQGDQVVYPTHGVGKIERIATEEIAGHRLELIHITFEKTA